MASLPRIAPMLGSPATCHRRGTEVHRLPGVDRHEVDRAYPDTQRAATPVCSPAVS